MLVCKLNRTNAKVTFSLSDDDPPGEVSVVGDFNEWRPGTHVLTRSTIGTRTVSLTLPRGHSYAFRYLGEGGRWFNEPDAGHADDGNNSLTT